MAGTGDVHLRPAEDSLLRVEELTVEFRTKAGTVQAVSNISFDVLPAETLGIVGESGCGKSTTGRSVMCLPRPTSGRVLLEGVDLARLRRTELRSHRAQMQIIFQDPISSLNPRRRVRDILAEPLRIAGRTGDLDSAITEVMESVGLDPSSGSRRPHEFSGGQCQRISIARALMLSPKLLILDEPVSALDVSVQAQILNLLEDLKQRLALGYVFIGHDLAVVKNISDRIAVMYLGKLCEVAPSVRLFDSPRHPYTQLLRSSLPQERRTRPPGANAEPPSPLSPPSGCRFRSRCPLADERCASEEPRLRAVGNDHFVACHRPLPANGTDQA